jgi:hypothetical protein
MVLFNENLSENFINFPEFIKEILVFPKEEMESTSLDFTEVLPIPVSECLSELLSGKFSDFEVEVVHGLEKKTFKVHKCILSRWGFFNTFLARGTPRDGTEPIPTEIRNTSHVTPMPISVFSKILDFFYSQVVNLTFTEAGWVLALAGYYHLEGEESFMNFCESVISLGLDDGNWFEALWRWGMRRWWGR